MDPDKDKTTSDAPTDSAEGNDVTPVEEADSVQTSPAPEQPDEGQETIKDFTIYTGEKGRNEEIINPVTGGNVIIGEGDASGFYLPMGTRVTSGGEEVTDITNLKIFIASIDSEQIGAQGIMKKGLGAYSFIVPSLSVKAYAAPGGMYSSIYNMEI